MKPEFSFYYGEQKMVLSVQKDIVYELEKEITVQVISREYPEYEAREWVLHFENKSGHNSQVFSEIMDCDTVLPFVFPAALRPGYMPKPKDACVITMNGMVDGRYYWENDKVSAKEYTFSEEYLDKAPGCSKSFANIGGRSSEGLMPFFDVTAGDCGYIAAVGWTGDWKAEFTKEDSGIRMRSGLKEAGFYLMPGEKVRTTSVLIMQYNSGEDKYNKFRRLIKNYFSHKSNTLACRNGLMAAELWGGLSSEEMKKRINQLKDHGIKFEDVWIDAGWYGQCTKCDEAFSGDWASHTGEWEVNSRVHPGELKDVAECAQAAGMKLMLWLEPERAIADTKIVKEHPEWFMSIPGNHSYILNYGNKEAQGYVCSLISQYIEKLGLSCYRQDFNAQLTEYFRRNDEENRRGITEIKHITGMYEMWEYLLKKHPGLLIDNCASGGRRIDIESLRRTIPFFRSDYQCNFNENPEVLQVHNSNISCYLPYNGCTSKTKYDTYAIRSSYSSSWGGAFYNAVFQSMCEEDFAWAKKITEEYKEIRKYFSCDFYNHGSAVFDETAWTIWQYHDSETDRGIVMAFRRCKSPFEQVRIHLKGLEEGKIYQYEDRDSGECWDGSDQLLMELQQQRSCRIIEYRGI